MLKLAIVVTFLTASVLSAPTADDLIVTIKDGKVQGATYVTPNNITFYGWRGIPFATPPVGNLRFETPQPPQPWTGVLNATEDGTACVGSGGMTTEMSEDCLYINVYTKSPNPAEKLPVMFWVYGGGFQGGDAAKTSYGPDYLVQEDVVLVTHNYRVGPMGFLSTGDLAIHGNAGLKDQVLAMKWTRENIAAFGGDPDKITIFGESAGGQSIGLHLVSKKSSGLFRAAIVQSGSVMTNSSATLHPEKYAFQLASAIPGGNYGNDTKKLAEFLKNCTADEIMTAVESIRGVDQTAWPVVEMESDEAFLTESPYVLYERGDINQVPSMMGICAEEGLARALTEVTDLASQFDADNKILIPIDLRPASSDEDVVAAKIKSIYLQEASTFMNNLSAAVKSDNRFARALIKSAELHSKYAPVYVYQFAYATTPAIIPGVESAAHGEEVRYLFYGEGRPDLRDDDTDSLVQRRTSNLWANFAKSLNPTPDKSELLENVTWPIATPNNMQYLNINATLEVRQDLKGNVYRNWNETYYTYGTQPFVTF